MLLIKNQRFCGCGYCLGYSPSPAGFSRNPDRLPHDDRVNKRKKRKIMCLFTSTFQKYFYIFYIALLCDYCDAGTLKNKYLSQNTNEVKSDIPNLPPSNMQNYVKANNDLTNVRIIDEEEKAITLKELCGNIVIIVFSTTWCPNCPSVLQIFDNLLKKITERGIKGIKIIALNVGNEDINEIKIHYKSHNIQMLSVYQSVSNDIMNGIGGVPACLVFDLKGKLVWGYLGGGIDFSADEFLNAIIKIGKHSK